MAAALQVTADSDTIPFDGSTAIHATITGLKEARDVPITVDASAVGLTADITIHVLAEDGGAIAFTLPQGDPGTLTPGAAGEATYQA